MCTSSMSWEMTSQKHHSEAHDYISEARLKRNDIDLARDEAERKAANPKWRKQGVFDELSEALDNAEGFLADQRAGKVAYRQKWEGILENAQSWKGKNLRRTQGQIRQFIRRLRDCQSEAAQLRQLVEKPRRELSL